MKNWINNLKNKIITILITSSNQRYEFSIPETPVENSRLSSFPSSFLENSNSANSNIQTTSIFTSLDKNLEFMKIQYNSLINSDIVIRKFTLWARGKTFNAFLFYIDGMSDTKLINDFVLKPLMLKNSANSYEGTRSKSY